MVRRHPTLRDSVMPLLSLPNRQNRGSGFLYRCGRWTLDLFIAIWFAWLAVLIVGFGYMLFSA